MNTIWKLITLLIKSNAKILIHGAKEKKITTIAKTDSYTRKAQQQHTYSVVVNATKLAVETHIVCFLVFFFLFKKKLHDIFLTHNICRSN